MERREYKIKLSRAASVIFFISPAIRIESGACHVIRTLNYYSHECPVVLASAENASSQIIFVHSLCSYYLFREIHSASGVVTKWSETASALLL
jgi:hypothetical protein